MPRRVGFDDHRARFRIFGRVAGAGHALTAAAAAELFAPRPERMVFADPSQPLAERAILVGHNVSGVRSVFDLSSLRSSCSAAFQNSSSRPSGLPACSHKRCARSLMSCSVGSDNFSSPLMKHGPTLGGMGALEAGPCRPAIGGDAGPPSQASIGRGSSNARAQRRGAPTRLGAKP